LDERRARLREIIHPGPRCFVTPQTDDPKKAARWFEQFEGAGLDGVVAKRFDQPYVAGQRVMVKVKHERTADCVIGGYRLSKAGDGIGSLLLGLYDETGTLRYAGHTSSFKAQERRELLKSLDRLKGGTSFEGESAPGGPSRWAQGRDTSWVPLKSELVCEVAFDHLQGMRFRHATRFLRWRPDKAPHDCTYDQLVPAKPFRLTDLPRD
jgi:ATP-dependent DNA ligase